MTNGMIALQQDGMIAYRRGRVSIRDRGLLESATCEDYRLITEAYDSLQRGQRPVTGEQTHYQE